jgi:hypothetical protein
MTTCILQEQDLGSRGELENRLLAIEAPQMTVLWPSQGQEPAPANPAYQLNRKSLEDGRVYCIEGYGQASAINDVFS